jgi:hypothetical protein
MTREEAMRLRISKWNDMWELWRVYDVPVGRFEEYVAASPDWRVLMRLATGDPAHLRESYVRPLA